MYQDPRRWDILHHQIIYIRLISTDSRRSVWCYHTPERPARPKATVDFLPGAARIYLASSLQFYPPSINTSTTRSAKNQSPLPYMPKANASHFDAYHMRPSDDCLCRPRNQPRSVAVASMSIRKSSLNGQVNFHV
jgi:hypothetical protein